MPRKTRKFDASRAAERPDSVSSATDEWIKEQFAEAAAADAADPFFALRSLSEYFAESYMQSYRAAREEFRRRGWGKEKSYGPAHFVACQLTGNLVNHVGQK